MWILAEDATAAVVLPDNVLFEACAGDSHPYWLNGRTPSRGWV
jgi:hypothetical protein